jgi:small subunit ribosomal protein S6e
MDRKLVISDPKTGKSFQKEVKDENSKSFEGMKIGDTLKGEVLDMTGYEFMVTGGSDHCGFPMRNDVPGVGRKRIAAVRGVGFTVLGRGQRQRKTVCGNTIHQKIAQVNLKITKYGATPLETPKAEGEEAK